MARARLRLGGRRASESGTDADTHHPPPPPAPSCAPAGRHRWHDGRRVGLRRHLHPGHPLHHRKPPRSPPSPPTSRMTTETIASAAVTPPSFGSLPSQAGPSTFGPSSQPSSSTRATAPQARRDFHHGASSHSSGKQIKTPEDLINSTATRLVDRSTEPLLRNANGSAMGVIDLANRLKSITAHLHLPPTS